MAKKTSIMMGQDGLPADSVGTYPAEPEHLQTFEQASQDMARWKAPALFNPRDPHAYLMVGLLDGTGNDVNNDPVHATNVAKFHEQLIDLEKSDIGSRVRAAYLPGPGTQDDFIPNTIDGATGRTSLERAEMMYLKLVEQAQDIYRLDPQAKIAIHLEGFSRGASQVPLLARMIDERGIPDPTASVIGRSQTGLPIYDKYQQPPGKMPMSVGLYDPVPTGYMELMDRRLPPSVVSGFQLTSIHERRGLFKSDQILPEGLSEDGRFLNLRVAGAHSDVGGSYLRNGLAIRSFNLMTDYHNHLLGEPVLERMHEPTDPRMNVIHRSEQGMLLYRVAPKVDRAAPEGQIRELTPDTSRYVRPGEVAHTPFTLPEALKVEMQRIAGGGTTVQRTPLGLVSDPSLSEGSMLASRIQQAGDVEFTPYKPPVLERPAVRIGGVLGAAGVATAVADAVHTGHRFETMLAQDNLLGAKHELRDYAANNANAWVAAYTVGKLGAELGGRRGVQGAIAGGIAGGIVGYVMSDKAMAGVDAREINKQVDAQGRHWEFNGNQWVRPMDADLSSTGQVQQVNFAADLDSRRELDYKATNKSVEIGMRRLSGPRDPYSLPASDQDKGSLRDANWTRDPGTGQWHRDRIADVDPSGRNIHDFQTATAERAAQLDQQAAKVIEANIANGPAPIAARYQIAHQLNGWEGPEPAAVSAALDANSLRASDGNQYRRGIDGQWRHGEDVAQGNLAAELDATRQALQPQLQSHEQVMAQLPEWQRPTQTQEDLASLAQTYRGFGLAPNPETLAAVQLAINNTRQQHGIDPTTTSLALDPEAKGARDINSPIMHLHTGNDGAVRVAATTTNQDVELARQEIRAQGLNLDAPIPNTPERRIEAQSPQEREAYTQALHEANRQGVSAPDAAQIATLASVQVRAPSREDREDPQVEPEVRQVRDPVVTEQPTRAVEPIPPVVELQTQEPEKVAREPGQPQPAAPELQGQARVQATEQPVPVVAATPAAQIEAQRPQDQERREQPPPAQKVSEAPVVEPRQPEPVVATEHPAPDQPGLRLGERGPDVEFLQHRLQRAGASGPDGQPVPLDGTYGVETQHAVREFQQAQGLPPTGVADQALDEALARAPQVRQEPVAQVEPEQPVQAAPEQVVERPSPEQREVQTQAVAEAQRQGATPEQVQQVAAGAVDQGQTVEQRFEVSEPSRAYAGPSMGGGGRSPERDEQQEPVQRQSHLQGFPTDHHDYALFVAIQQQLPKGTPDEKTAELMHQAKLGGIKRPDQLDEVVVENDRAWVFGKTAGSYSQEVSMGAQAPAMNETLQRNQDFDQQQALQMQQFQEQQARINQQNQGGPSMTM